MIEVQIEPGVKDLRPGIVFIRGLRVGPSSVELRAACADIVSGVLKDGMGGGEPRREAVRRMLRAGGYKPAGRNKPAQEYLRLQMEDLQIEDWNPQSPIQSSICNLQSAML